MTQPSYQNKRFSLLFTISLALLILLTQSGFGPPIQTTPEPQTGVQGLTAQITQVDTSQFPRVTAYVSVTDASGEPVAVSPNQIVLLENGKELKLDEVGSAEDIGPLTTLLVMDISGSMNHGGKLKAAKEAAKAYVDQARTSDQIGLITFNTEIEYEQPLTADRRKMISEIHGLTAKNDTAMYDALAEGIAILESVPGRKAIIVLTDGLDNRSKMSPQQVLQLIGPQGLSISVIGLGDPSQSTGAITSLDEPGLLAFAEQAGGLYGYANDAESLRLLYQKYGRALQSEYIVGYTSPSKLRDGVNRALNASLRDSVGLLDSGQSSVSYNPGGLVPEVAQPASWFLFLALIIGLVLLLFVPFLLGFIRSRDRGKKEDKGGEKKGGVHLHPQPAPAKPRVKLKG